MIKKESLSHTLFIAFTVIFCCSIMVSGAVTLLRPIQVAQNAPQQSRPILIAAGLIDAAEVESDDFEKKQLLLLQQVKTEFVDLNKSELVNLTAVKDGQNYDYQSVLENPEYTSEIEGKNDLAKLERRPNVMPVYRLFSSATKTKIVLPIYGNGMWSVIHGYVGLEEDFNTISGVYFYQHEETPGIGDRIQGAEWLATWKGKKIYNENGELTFNISKTSLADNSPLKVYQIDSLTGATKTVKGVANIMLYWFGEDGYQTFLTNQKH